MPADFEDLFAANDLSELVRIAAWIDGWAQSRGLRPEVTERLHVCCAEAATNIIMHGGAGSGPDAIRLALRETEDTVELEIDDDGVAFDLRRSPEPPPSADLATARIGGWGIRIIRRFSDEMRYRRAGGRNVLTLVFRLSAKV
jgi:serine/threonine-protein kinase RsbW